MVRRDNQKDKVWMEPLVNQNRKIQEPRPRPPVSDWTVDIDLRDQTLRPRITNQAEVSPTTTPEYVAAKKTPLYERISGWILDTGAVVWNAFQSVSAAAFLSSVTMIGALKVAEATQQVNTSLNFLRTVGDVSLGIVGLGLIGFLAWRHFRSESSSLISSLKQAATDREYNTSISTHLINGLGMTLATSAAIRGLEVLTSNSAVMQKIADLPAVTHAGVAVCAFISLCLGAISSDSVSSVNKTVEQVLFSPPAPEEK